MTANEPGVRNALRWIATFVAAIPARIVLQDHVRLPGRFFGRMTATAQAQL
jgi:hypothetical protein